MSLLLVVVSVLMMIGAIYFISDHSEELALLIISIGFAAFICSLIMIICNVEDVVNGRTYDKKIEMYQKENQKIETQVDTIVKQYMTHEDKTFTDAKIENSMTLVSLYPDLKSDSLVKEQIKIYNKNNSKIKELKESKIDVSTAKWWLYFGE